jgi:Uma2 family endonuclease
MEPTTTDAPPSPPEPLSKKERYTYADYQQLPEGAPYQLINGSLVMAPSPATRHQRIVAYLYRSLYNHAPDRGEVLFAPMDVKLSDTDVLQPDLMFVSESRLDRIGEQVIDGAPDLVMEVLSPATAHHDLTTKKRLYEVHGVQEYWIIDPDSSTVEVHTNTDTGFTQHARQVDSGTASSALLSGLTVTLDSLFAA